MLNITKLYGKGLDLSMLKMRKLYILCFIYFLNINSSVLSGCRDVISGIDAVEVSLKKHDNKLIKCYGEITDLGLGVKLWICPSKTCCIKSLEYSGLELTLKYEDRRYPHHLDIIDAKEDGSLEMKDETGEIVSDDQVYVTGIRFRVIIEFNGGQIVDTYIKFTNPTRHVKYVDLIKDNEFEYNFEFNGRIHTEVLMGGQIIEDLSDNISHVDINDTYNTFDLMDFNNTPIYIKISNFYRNGYIYYEDFTGKERRVLTYRLELNCLIL
ncbi:hypothetical protein SLOPH_638 [Spraguea lophii 42_110]|uniref:Uncharacterized protein n=1 Tax=Spraguea lophii (strain 42_110) TaxID=1358809 RepID=S7W4Z5_SPRLO|nr:hypothetical protein SLOPH_638 [Spraguea lophii 42_110]